MHAFQIGCCASIDQAPLARQAGFDYLECPLVSLIPEADDAAFASVQARYEQAELPVRAFNIFLPSDLKVVGPQVDPLRSANYVQRALTRAWRLGAEVIVFGSGGARMIPPGFERAQALDQLTIFLHQVADAAETHDLTVAIEPLNRKESNVINSVAEAVALAERVNRPSIQVLADFYHMDEEGEPLHELTRHRAWLAHIHVADRGRLAPGTGDYPYPEFAAALAAANYTGMVSMECRWGDFAAEAGPAVSFLRQALAPSANS